MTMIIPPFRRYAGGGRAPSTQSYAISNDGTGASSAEYVSIPYNAAFGFSGNVAFSVSFWYLSNTSPTYATLFTKSSATGGGNSAANDYGFDLRSTPSLEFRVNSTNVAFGVASVSTGITTGTWFHICGTFDGTALILYRNGVSVGSASSAGGVRDQGNAIFLLRDSFLGAGSALNGYIDDTRIYNAKLSSTDVLNLYNKVDVTTNLVLQWEWEQNGTDKKGVQNATVGASVPYVAGVPGLPL